jgi:hypothetical protein
MNYFVLVDGRETGPFSPAILNRMHRKGEVRGEHLCRAEKGVDVRRLDEVFRHFAPPQDVVVEARKNVAQWNLEAGAKSLSFGGLMIFIGVLRMLLSAFMDLRGIALVIVGIGLVANGLAQRRRGLEAKAKFAAGQPVAPPSAPSAPSAPAAAAEAKEDTGGRYNY